MHFLQFSLHTILVRGLILVFLDEWTLSLDINFDLYMHVLTSGFGSSEPLKRSFSSDLDDSTDSSATAPPSGLWPRRS